MINDQTLHQSTISARVLITQILLVLSMALNIYQKINYVTFSYMYLLEFEFSNVLFEKNNNIFANMRDIGNRAHFRTGGDRCLQQKNEYVNIFFSSFLTP